MKAAIDTLNEIYNDKYKIAILGDMLELGENEVDYHIDVLNYLLDKKIKYNGRHITNLDKIQYDCHEIANRLIKKI